MAHGKQYGASAEAIVSQYLQDIGYTICDTNYAIRHGEIDVIARYADIYVFVEVKARKHPRFAMSDTITPRKQSKIIRTAQAYIHTHKLTGYRFRFDVALVAGSNNVSYIKHAFMPEDMIS